MQKNICIILMVMLTACATAQQAKHARRFNYTAKGCQVDSLKKQSIALFTRYNEKDNPFIVDVTETDSFFIIRKYPAKPAYGGTVDVWISKTECKVVKERWGQ
ncbi:hypothetical protein HGH92_03255 [Chitinophaga varians]|uniref:Lipoprotein n=1 Tax=Chitinophaga varians TaxID=2202339 RepID=A0A847RJQ3_9BACT|nr:hypothetical protein [Chitinophaga varians]NLR63313.1 hypothetical protein [Chitinophaga varians]